MTIEELFGTLQMSVVSGWRKHLRSAKYGNHKALQEFYEEMPDKVDELIEAWMGAHGKKVGNFTNIISAGNLNTLSYLKELKKVCKEGYMLMGENDELKSLLDDIVNLINSTLYKVKELSESAIGLVDFVKESLNESAGAALDQRSVERFFGDKYGRDRKLKTAISKSLHALKTFKSEFTSEQYDMLEKLIDNPENEFDYRSKASVYDVDKYGAFEFVLTANNFPRAIINKLDDVTVNKIFKDLGKGYRISMNGFGVTQTLLISIEWENVLNDGKWLSREDAVKLTKYVLDAIAPIFNDILSWREEGKERDAFARRNRVRESVNESVNDAKKLIKDMYDEDGDLVSVASCYHWLSSLDWEEMSEDEYAQEITYINDDIDFVMAKLRYTAVMVAMAQIGKNKTIQIIKSIVSDKSELKDYDIE